MQDKIQEIMELVDDLSGWCDECNFYKALEIKLSIQSKLRELVREPLSDDQIDEYIKHADMHGRYAETFARGVRWGIRNYERVHGITNTSGVER